MHQSHETIPNTACSPQTITRIGQHSGNPTNSYKPTTAQVTAKISSIHAIAFPQPGTAYNRICCAWLPISIGVPYMQTKDKENRE
jgi:hypothetical protein